MRWASYILAVVGVAQFAILAYLQPDSYVSVDMAYLVMFLCILGAIAMSYASCWAGCYGSDDGCDCCSPGCKCGDCEGCSSDDHGHGHKHGDEGHAGHKH